jgi:hypothetical protein
MTSETRSPLHCGGGVAHVHRRANILHFEEKALIDLAETREKEKERSKYSIKEKKEKKLRCCGLKRFDGTNTQRPSILT